MTETAFEMLFCNEYPESQAQRLKPVIGPRHRHDVDHVFVAMPISPLPTSRSSGHNKIRAHNISYSGVNQYGALIQKLQRYTSISADLLAAPLPEFRG
jgi:hypothetical protein